MENYRNIRQWEYRKETEKIKKVDGRRKEGKNNDRGGILMRGQKNEGKDRSRGRRRLKQKL